VFKHCKSHYPASANPDLLVFVFGILGTGLFIYLEPVYFIEFFVILAPFRSVDIFKTAQARSDFLDLNLAASSTGHLFKDRSVRYNFNAAEIQVGGTSDHRDSRLHIEIMFLGLLGWRLDGYRHC